MKTHTTNYINTFIVVAEDCPADKGEVPPIKGEKKSVANMQFDMLIDHPYKYTSDDVLFLVYAERNGIKKMDLEKERTIFFSKGQACLRASPLTKRYGWGVHSNERGEIALYSSDSEEYRRLSTSKDMKIVKAMKSSR